MAHNLIGRRFGKLVVQSRVPGSKFAYRLWACLCDCGKTSVVISRSLVTGNTTTCGCGKWKKTHGHTINDKHTTEYGAWNTMKDRCHNRRSRSWKNYGGRGIRVCREWRNSFDAFFSHIGPKPSPELSVDRIDNNDGYRPGNVRWATAIQQARNSRRKRKVVKYKGKSATIEEWALGLGLTRSGLADRLRTWTIHRALTTPARGRQ